MVSLGDFSHKFDKEARKKTLDKNENRTQEEEKNDLQEIVEEYDDYNNRRESTQSVKEGPQKDIDETGEALDALKSRVAN